MPTLLHSLHAMVRSLRRDDHGATAVEYGLIVAMIAAVVAGVVVTLGTSVEAAFNTVIGAF